MAAWSQEENEATVADYFDMLRRELRAEPYNKAEHNRRLQRLLRDRSGGAIERKHMNISAILHEIGFPCIDGYKPYRNYQALLRDVVVDRLSVNQEIVQVVADQVDRPAEMPPVLNVLEALTDPPASRSQSQSVRENPWVPRKVGRVRAVDYLERESRNRELGEAGESFVIRFEQERLARAGCERLASGIEHVARTRGPSAGFDVLSFETTGRERLIEVKTTRYGKETPFYISRNEVETSEFHADKYQIYRVFRFGQSPGLFQLPGAVPQSCDLMPTQFIATAS